MTHGKAILKENLLAPDGNVLVKKGEEGLVTAYLPEMERFAIMFSENRWITFNETEEQFLQKVEYSNNEQ